MVYKRYIIRNGKKFGPYFYESHRDKDGNITTSYVPIKPASSSIFFNKHTVFISIFFVITLILLFILHFTFTGHAIGSLGTVDSNIDSLNPDSSYLGLAQSSEEVSTAIGSSNQEISYLSEQVVNGSSELSSSLDSNQNSSNNNEINLNISNGEMSSFESSNLTLFENISVNNSISSNDNFGEKLNKSNLSEEEAVFENSSSLNNSIIFSEVIDNNSLSVLTLIKSIETIRVSKKGHKVLNLDEYFLGAENYSLKNIDNIDFHIKGNQLEFIPYENFSGAIKTSILASAGNQTIFSNEFTILISSSSLNVQTLRSSIKLNEPVLWVAVINSSEGNISSGMQVELPEEAENISLKVGAAADTAINEVSVSLQESLTPKGIGLTGFVIKDNLVKEGTFTNFFKKFFRSFNSHFTGNVISSEPFAEQNTSELSNGKIVSLDTLSGTSNDVSVAIEYTTPAPVSYERLTSFGKIVIISGPEELNYTNIISFTNLPEIFDVGQESIIKIFWVENQSFVPVDAYDLDGNGKLDYLEWITPHLSNQTFEIILVARAEHLSSNFEFISNIFDSVKSRDENWSEPIYNQEYVRVIFEKNLTNKNDITVYAKSVDGNPVTIEVYKEGSNVSVAKIENINVDKKYQTFLTSMDGSSDSFYLKIIGNVLFDYILDPSGITVSFVPPTSENDSWNKNILSNVSIAGEGYALLNLDNSIVAWWRGESVANDEFGNYNGTMYSVVNNATYGNFGSGFYFVGNSSSYIQASSSLADRLSLNNSFTVSVWFKTDDLTTRQTIFQSRISTLDSFGISLIQGQIRVSFLNGSAIFPRQLSISNNNWHHLVCVYNLSTLVIYLDNVSDNINAGAGAALGSGLGFYMGKRYPNYYYFNGSIDEFVVFNRSLDATEVGALYNASSSWFFRQFNVSEGIHNFIAYAVDSSGSKQSTETRTLFIDTILPFVQIISPSNLSNYTTLSTINYAYSDLNPEKCWYSLNLGMTNSSPIAVQNNFSSVAFLEGQNNLTLFCNDSAGNVNYSLSTLIIDSLSPNILIYFPYNSSSYQSNNFSVGYSVSDLHLNKCWWSRDFGETNYSLASCSENITGQVWDQETNTVYVYTNDTFGNLNRSEVSFFIDSVYPLINFVSPTVENNSFYSSSNISITVSAYDSHFVNLSLYLYNSSEKLLNSTTSSNSTLSATFTNLAEGIFYFNSTSCDSSGNCNNTFNRKVTLDFTPPIMSILYPNQVSYSSQLQNISFSATDLNGLSECWNIINNVELQRKICSSPNDSFVLGSGVLSEGVNNLTIYAKDVAGNIQFTTKSILLDTLSPLISFIEPTTTSGNYSSSFLYVNVSAFDLTFANISLNIFNSSGFYYSTTLNNSSNLYLQKYMDVDGIYYINATAQDYFGRTNFTETRQIIFDRISPVVSFSSGMLTNSSSFSSDTLYVNSSVSEVFRKNITFILYDEVGKQVVDLQTFTNNTNEVYLNSVDDGSYSVEVIVADWVGHTSSSGKRDYTKDTRGPIVDLWEYVSNNSAANVNFRVRDSPTSVSKVVLSLYSPLHIFLGNYSLSRMSGSEYSGLFNINLTSLSQYGDYVAQIFANDSGGAFSVYNYSFDIYPSANLNIVSSFSDNLGYNFSFQGLSNNWLNFTTNTSLNYLVKNRTYTLLVDSPSNSSIIFNNLSVITGSKFNIQELNNLAHTSYVPLYKSLKILAVSLENMSFSGGASINLDYAGKFDANDYPAIDETLLTVHKCSDWNMASKSCLSSWSQVSPIELNSNLKKIFINITSFSAYAITEYRCGNGICESAFSGESVSNCPSDCQTGENLGGNTGSGGGGGGGGGGGSGSVQQNIDTGISTTTNRIYETLMLGENKTSTVIISNSKSSPIPVFSSIEGDVASIIEIINANLSIPSQDSSIITFHIFGKKEGIYTGYLVVSPFAVKIPITVIIQGGSSKLLDISIFPEKKSFAKGEQITFRFSAINMGKLPRYDLDVTYELVNIKENKTIYSKQEAIAIETTISQDKELEIPKDAIVGDYLLRVKVNYGIGTAISSSNIFIGDPTLVLPIWAQQYLPFGTSILVILFMVFVGFYYFKFVRKKLFEKKMEEIKKNSIYTFPNFESLPQSKFADIGQIADTQVKTYLDYTQLNRHTLVAGGTGSGKTIAGMVIAEELLKKDSSVIVFDPVGQWSGFFNKNGDKNMLSKYHRFGMGSPKNFKGRIIPINKETMNIDIKYYTDKSGLTIFKLDGLSPIEMDKFVFDCLEKLYRGNLKEVSTLKTLLVFDECHRLLPKYGGKKAYVKLEQAVREFRKWGIGLLMISQVLTDFKGAIRGNIGTEIQMFSRYEGDIKRVRERHGSEVSKIVSKLPTGLGMVEAAGYNNGNPYFVEFRPILHSPLKLDEKELKSYIEKNPVLLKE